MLTLTRQEANRVITYTNGFPMTYADYLDNTNREFEVVELEVVKTKLLDRIYDLETQAERLPYGEDRDNIKYEVRELNDRYTDLCKVDCVADGTHMKRTVSQGGYDVCFNCESKS